MFYAEGADVVRHNLNNGDKTVLYTAPDGYSISCMKFRSDDTFIYSGDLGRYLTIGMNKGDEGAIAEVRLNTASDVDETYPIVVYNTDNEGNKLGNIKDVQTTIHLHSFHMIVRLCSKSFKLDFQYYIN